MLRSFRGRALARARAFAVSLAATGVTVVGAGIGSAPQVHAQGFLDALFGGFASPNVDRRPTIIREPAHTVAPPNTVAFGPFGAPPQVRPGRRPFAMRYKTVCVRVCDGYFFPLSFSTPRSRFADDEAVCAARCPGQGRLFTMATPDGQIEDAVDPHGARYADLDTAFRYRTSFTAGCGCRPDPWSRAERLRHAMYATAEANGERLQGDTSLVIAGNYPGPVKPEAIGREAGPTDTAPLTSAGPAASVDANAPPTSAPGTPAIDSGRTPGALPVVLPAPGSAPVLGSPNARLERATVAATRPAPTRRERPVRAKATTSGTFLFGAGQAGKLRWPGD